MSKTNIIKELILNGNNLNKVAINKNPYLKDSDKIIATVKYVDETLKDYSRIDEPCPYSADLVRQFDAFVIGEDGCDVVFGLDITEYPDEDSFMIDPEISPKRMFMFSDGIYGIYIASKAIFPNGKIKTLKRQLDTTDYYDLYWNPKKCPTVILSTEFKDLRIRFNNDSNVKTTLYYPNCSLLSDKELICSSSYTNITVVIDNTNHSTIRANRYCVLPYASTIKFSKKYFEDVDLIDVRGYFVDLSKLTNLKNVDVELLTTNYDTNILKDNIRRFFNLYDSGSKTYTITINGA